MLKKTRDKLQEFKEWMLDQEPFDLESLLWTRKLPVYVGLPLATILFIPLSLLSFGILIIRGLRLWRIK